MKKSIQAFILLFSVHSAVIAQQITPLSNFMYNQLVYNPASAGMHDAQFNVSTLARLQWTSIQGAPKAGMLWSDYRFKSNKMALGINLGTLSYSGYQNTDVNLNYAYYLNLTRKLKLSMGLRAGFTSLGFSTSKFQIWDDDDQVIATSGYNKIVPKFGLGFQLNSRNAYIGIASADLITPNKVDITGDTASSFFKRKRNIVLMSGAKLKLGDLYNLRPNVGVFYYPDSKILAKLNATFEIKDYFWAGITYSTNKFGAINLGTNISSRIRFGYAFETYIGGGVGLTTHELNLFLTLDNLFQRK
ncbi:MAG TPA: PorP/SprF family type IX secretion system membrane protein [Cytophagaceae bacterium]|nr:PorP/SprF family type IX secretion system membrane protein [Cytophagaceae bacterium]